MECNVRFNNEWLNDWMNEWRNEWGNDGHIFLKHISESVNWKSFAEKKKKVDNTSQQTDKQTAANKFVKI